MTVLLNDFLQKIGFHLHPLGYENFFTGTVADKIKRVHHNPSVRFVRYMPDVFAYYNEQHIALFEYKICNTPIYSENRVAFLRNSSGDASLSKANIGAIELAALENYQALSQIGIEVVLVVFSPYHTRGQQAAPLVAQQASRVQVKHADAVRFGQNNASRTPFANINLNEFCDFDIFLCDRFGIPLDTFEVPYKQLLKSLI